MKPLLLAALLGLATLTQAQTLRWASQGDLQTADPHSQNESMTNMVNGQVYEKLVKRNKDMSIGPGLAVSWTNPDPLTWRFKLRPNVRFHDGAPFTADDVVFSIERGKQETSNVRIYANQVGTARKLDAQIVEFKLERPNPIFLQHIDTLWILNKPWAEKHKVTRPQDFKNKEESHSALNANGTGPYMLVSRQPAVKNDLQTQSDLVGPRSRAMCRTSSMTPIASDGTRLAALLERRARFGAWTLRRATSQAPAPAAQCAGHRWPGEPPHLHRLRSAPRQPALRQEPRWQEPVQGQAACVKPCTRPSTSKRCATRS